MANADQVKALVRSHAEGDDSRFYAIAMQVAAQAAHSGHGKFAQELRALVDQAKARAKVSATTLPRPIPVAQPRGELAGLLSVCYPKTRIAEMALDDDVRRRIARVLMEQRQRERIRGYGFTPIRKLLSRFERYAQPTPRQKKEQRHEDMIDRVATLRLATLRGLWTDASDVYPEDDESIWWEVWLRRHDGEELQRLMEFAELVGINVAERRIEFDERIVVLVRSTPRQLSSSIDVLNDVAELRRAKETAALFVDMDAAEQAEWINDLLRRTTPPDSDSPTVCLLDTGVTRGHPLLADSLATVDCHTCDPAWGTHDHEGHGTEMAGLALFGDLTPLLIGTQPVILNHRLESVKILPPPSSGANPPDLYGAITAEAIGRAEVQAPRRRRCFSMAVTAIDQSDRGQPTSWSAAIDALAVGRTFDPARKGLVYLDDGSAARSRLILVSAGNVGSIEVAHLNRSDTEAVHDPAQAWNALTVGAYTEKATIQHTLWNGWRPVARAGDLSPWSTTSLTFGEPWPLKPDVVFEGGNIAWDGNSQFDSSCPDLCLLSTHFNPAQKLLVETGMTSAATAQVARMAAIISSEYPGLWPEAVRGLVVHSAEWTRAMQAHLPDGSRKRDRGRLVRRYGYGVPRLDRALRSA